MRLLIVEDEEKTSSYVHRGLSELGYIVDVATNASMACTMPWSWITTW